MSSEPRPIHELLSYLQRMFTIRGSTILNFAFTISPHLLPQQHFQVFRYKRFEILFMAFHQIFSLDFTVYLQRIYSFSGSSCYFSTTFAIATLSTHQGVEDFEVSNKYTQAQIFTTSAPEDLQFIRFWLFIVIFQQLLTKQNLEPQLFLLFLQKLNVSMDCSCD